jgi:hypothetical protein
MTREEVVKRVTEEAREREDGRKVLACGRAFRVAKECGVPVKVIGDICAEKNVKIIACQLGCFR